MEKDSGHKLSELKVDGGMSNSELCMQTQADLVAIPIVRPKMRETTALGAAIAAGFAVDVWKNFDELKEIGGKWLGFRGEALSSMAEMCGLLCIITRVEGEVVAVKLSYNRKGEMTL